MGIQYLDNEKLYYSFVSGAQEVIRNKAILNEINVFPVADGDTGSNLASTMNAIIQEAQILPSVKETMSSIADAALMGARGNSGIIIAEYINGIFMSLRDEEQITMSSFAETVNLAYPHAYHAIENPVEGTIITVIRDWAEAINHHKDLVQDFSDLLSKAMEVAAISLKETTSKLKVLEHSKVVDSGAKGFVYFIQGFAEFLKTGKLLNVLPLSSEEITFTEPLNHDQKEILHRYCTEALLEVDSLSGEQLKQELMAFGDSLIIAGNDHRTKIHIHSNTPEKVFQILRKKGKILQQKADDMIRQNEDVYGRKYEIALVTDSIADLPKEIIDKYQIHMFPLNLVFDGTTYLDKVTITPEIFYPLLDESTEYPKSAQPNQKTLELYLEALTAHYDKVIVITVASQQSGTNSVFKKASEKFIQNGKMIKVIDSKQNSGAEGLLVMKAAELIHEGLGFEDVIERIEKLRDRAKILVSVNTLKYMVRSGRLGKFGGIAGRMLNLKPVISIDEKGKGKIEGKAFSEKTNTRIIMEIVRKTHAEKGITRYAIVHANDLNKALDYKKKCMEILGKEPEYIMNISPIMGMSAGIGCVAVSYIWEEDLK
ncbi:MAG: DegV family protein [Clostridiaceae bacterium]